VSVLWASAAAAGSGTLVLAEEAAAAVRVVEVDNHDGAVSAVLINQSKRRVRDVKLLVHHTWLWRDERHPGEDSPGRSEYYVVQGDVPAGGRLPFTYQPSPPLPNRSDGHFETSVEVVGLTEVGG